MSGDPDSSSENAKALGDLDFVPADALEPTSTAFDVKKAVTKLDVPSSQRINKLTRLNLFALAFSCLYALITNDEAEDRKQPVCQPLFQRHTPAPFET